MKSKAKSAKGSARTKRFDVGGTVGALAGLGTLAYLMSRKKKGAAAAEGPEFKPRGKFPSEDGSGTSGPGMDEYKPKVDEMKPKVDDAGRQRALAASMGRPEMGDADSESDKALVRTDGEKTTPVVKDKKPKPRIPPKAQVGKSGQGSTSTTGVDAGIAAGNKKRPAGAFTSLAAPKPKTPAQDKKDVTTSIKDRNATTLEKGTAEEKFGIGPYGTFGSIHKALSDTRSEEEKQRSADAISRAWKGKKEEGKKAGGAVKKYANGGSVKASSMGSVKQAKPSMGSASKRADGIAQRGKTRGRVC